MTFMDDQPPPLPYEPRLRGRVIGYAGRFGPGRQSLLIGLVCVGLQLLTIVFWRLAPDGARLLAMVFAAHAALIVYLLILPALVVGVVRASTAFRLGIELRAGTVGAVLNLLGIAVWLTPILRAIW